MMFSSRGRTASAMARPPTPTPASSGPTGTPELRRRVDRHIEDGEDAEEPEQEADELRVEAGRAHALAADDGLPDPVDDQGREPGDPGIEQGIDDRRDKRTHAARDPDRVESHGPQDEGEHDRDDRRHGLSES